MVNFNSNLPEGLRKKLEATLQSNAASDLVSINEALKAQADDYNHTPQAELQGYTPAMCYALRHEWNTPGSPVQFDANLGLANLKDSKTFQEIRTMLLAVHEADGVKATARGNFNRQFVESMIDPLLSTDAKEALLRYNKVVNEPDFSELHEGRIVAQVAGLLVKRKGMIRFVKKHAALLEAANAGRLFVKLFDAYFRKYNIGYLHPYGIDVDWIQHEINFLLYPLSLKAQRWLNMSSFADELLHPLNRQRLQQALDGQNLMDTSDVVERYFVRPLHQWGLLEVQWSKDKYYPRPERVCTSPLFQQFIRFETSAE